MKPIIEPVDREALLAELNEKTFLRKTNRAGNELYVVGPESVQVIREIGRLREIAFRTDGGGTGKELDIDEFDTNPAYGYKQLVLWDPQAREIIGGYRFCLCDQAVFDRFGQPILTSSHMFEFSKKFLKDYLPYTLELGRSFVQYFGRHSRLIRIRKEVKVEHPHRYSKLFKGLDFKEGYKVLKAEITKMGVFIPPLVNTYMNLSPTMDYFGTGINDEFGDVYDSGLMINFEDLYPEKRQRHLDSFLALGWQHLRKLLRRLQNRVSR